LPERGRGVGLCSVDSWGKEVNEPNIRIREETKAGKVNKFHFIWVGNRKLFIIPWPYYISE